MNWNKWTQWYIGLLIKHTKKRIIPIDFRTKYFEYVVLSGINTQDKKKKANKSEIIYFHVVVFLLAVTNVLF